MLPIIPPMVQRVCVEGSGPKRRPWAVAALWRVACTVPGSTVAVPASGSRDSTRLRWREVSTTMPVPTALPAIDVPAPRMVSGVPLSRATATVAASSSTERGRTTTCGTTR